MIDEPTRLRALRLLGALDDLEARALACAQAAREYHEASPAWDPQHHLAHREALRTLHAADANLDELTQRLADLRALRDVLDAQGLTRQQLNQQAALAPVLRPSKARARARRIPDLDPEIAEPVAALQRYGILTLQSCQGHAQRGLPYPWVQIHPQHAPRLDALLIQAPLNGFGVHRGVGGPRLQPILRVLPTREGMLSVMEPDWLAEQGIEPDADERARLLITLTEHQRLFTSWAMELLGG